MDFAAIPLLLDEVNLVAQPVGRSNYLRGVAKGDVRNQVALIATLFGVAV